MNFLNPSAFWFLGFLIIPLIIHFLNQFKVQKVEFSTIRFIKELESSSIKKMKFENFFLLLIRLLIIFLLVIICANPVTKGFLPSWIGSAQESIIVFIIDNSASMNAEINGNKKIEKAKIEALNTLTFFEPESKILVYQTCPPKQIFTGFKDDPSLRNQINNIKETSSFDNIWENMITFLSEDSLKNPIKECLIFSDFMYPPDTLLSSKFSILKKWKFYLINFKDINDNAVINSVVLLNRIKTINQLIKLDAKIYNSGKIDKTNLPLELIFNDQRVGQIISDIKSNQNKGFLFQAYPTNNGIVHGQFIISKDDYVLDNTWHIAIPILNQIRCAIIGSNEQEVELLELLLKSIDPEKKFLFTETRIQPTINRLFLDQFDVAIIHNSQELTSEGVKDLDKFFRSGGGIIWFQGNNNYESYHNDLFEKLNFPKNIGIINSGEGFFSVNMLNKNSDLMKDIQIRNIENQLPEVTNYSQIIINSEHKVHWSLNNSDPFILEFEKESGVIFYFSTILDLKWSDLPIKGILVPLIYRMLIFSGTDELNTLPVTIDQPKWISIKEDYLRKKWEVKSLNGTNNIIIPDYDKEGILIKNTSELGLYNIYSDGKLFTSFPTRLHSLEYIKSRINYSILEQYIPKENLVWLDIQDDFKKEFSEIRNGKTLWRFYLFVLLILVLVETIIGRPDPLRLRDLN